MRPPMERPPSTSRFGLRLVRCASAAAPSRTAARSTAGLSGDLRPARRYGKSMRSTGTGDNDRSMATSDGWSRPAPAPGVSSRARSAFLARADVTPSRRKEDAPRLAQLEDAQAGAVVLGAVVGVRLADEEPEARLDLDARRVEVGTEAQHLKRPTLVGRKASPVAPTADT